MNIKAYIFQVIGATALSFQKAKKRLLDARILFVRLTLFLLSTIILNHAFVPSATAVDCGETLVLSGGTVSLDSDLDCTTTPHPPLTVKGPGTFDMNGHKIICGGGASAGLYVIGVRTKVLNGAVVSGGSYCEDCIRVEGDGHHTLEGVVARGCGDDGFRVDSERNMLKNVVAVGNIFGFFLRSASKHNTISDSHAINNYIAGFTINGDHYTVRDSTAIGNGRGIVVLGENTKLHGNTIISNDEDGIIIGFTDNFIRRNRALDNGGMYDEYDLYDEYISCDNNRWRSNIFGSANRDCIE